MNTTKTVMGLGVVISFSAGCWSFAENHCGNNGGDATCAERGTGMFCNFCEEKHDGCVDERPSDDCYFAGPGQESSTSVGTSDDSTDPTVAGTEPTSATEATSSPSTTMSASASESSSGPSGCLESSECVDPALPICVDLACVACTGAGETACSTKDAAAPACRDDGQCVQCTSADASACSDTTPVCDGAASACVACSFHEQCEGSACRIATGACFDTDEVYDVGSGQTYTTIGAAVSDLGEGVQVVLVLHAGDDFNQGVTVSGADTAYAFISADDPAPQWVRTSGMGPTLTVEDGAEAYVQNVRLTGNLYTGAAGIEADGASVYLDRAEVVGNDGGGILLQGSAFGQIRNAFVGGSDTDVVALEVNNASAMVLYSTLAAASFGSGASLRCSSPDSVVVRNSLLIMQGPDDEIQCTAADISYSASEDQAPGTGNTALGDMNTNWFVGYAAGDFHLTGNIPDVSTTAQWTAGDPLVDIDGDGRPGVDAAADVAGADIP